MSVGDVAVSSLRFNQLSVTLSHVVMGRQEQSEVKTIREMGHWYGGRRCSQIMFS